MARYLFTNTDTDEQTIVEDTPPFDAADHLEPGTYTVAALSDVAEDEVVVTIPVPANTAAPAITGALVDGGTASLSTGSWSPTPDEIEREWLADGVAAGSGATLDLTGREGETIGARTRARMTGGAWSAWATATGGGVVTAVPTTPVIVSPGNIDAQPLVGQAMLVAEPEVTGATSTAYQWYDGDPANGGVALSGLTSATFTPTATQYALSAPVWRRATYTNDSGSVIEDLQAPAVVGFVWSDDFSALAVGADTAAIVAAGYTQWSNAAGQAWTGAVVAAADGPAGKGVSFTTSSTAIYGASPNAPAAFLPANGFDYYEELIMFVHDGTGGRFAFRGKNQASNINVPLTNLAPGLSIRLNAAHHQLPGDDPTNTAGTGMGSLTANSVYFVRHRIQGNESRLKIWLASEAEPNWSLANVRTYGSPLGTYGPGMLARITGHSKTCLYMACGANTPAPYWPGYVPPAEVITDPMAYSASASATSASMFNSTITFNLEDI